MRLMDVSPNEMLAKNKRFVCYGAGNEFSKFIEVFRETEILDKIECVIDNGRFQKEKFYSIDSFKIPIYSLKEYLMRECCTMQPMIITVGTLLAAEVLDSLQNIHEFDSIDCFFSEWLILKAQGGNYSIRNTFEPLIPKKIHYVWFGDKSLSDLNKKCIDSWQRFCPNFEIVKWDESNYDFSKNHYAKTAYYNGYFAHASDYARLDIIYKYGGIYLDTDVEILKDISDLLYNQAFAGINNPYDKAFEVNLGLGFGAVKHFPLVKEMRDMYDELSFINEGKVNETTNTKYQTSYLKKRGYRANNHFQLIANMSVFPYEVFSPMDPQSGKINKTSNSYMLHHFESSWGDLERIRRNKEFVEKSEYIEKKYKKKVGENIW